MISNKKIFFNSIGLIIKEIKKSFFLSSIFFIILFGVIYLFTVISLGFYQIIDNATKANLFFVFNLLGFIIIASIFFIILNKIRKITLLKAIDLELKNKNKKFLEFIDKYLDLEFKKSINTFNKYLRFFTTIIFCVLVLFFLLGLWTINIIALKIIVLLLILSLFGPFILFVTRQVFYVKDLKELIFDYKVFAKHYVLFFWTFITSIIPLIIIISLFFLPNFSGKIYLLLILLSLVITIIFYFNFFVFSQLFIERNKL